MKADRFKFRVWNGEDQEMVEDVFCLHMYLEWQDCGDDIVIMQSTGLTDKNGKEIFEGDIMEGGTWPRLRVAWIDNKATFGCWSIAFKHMSPWPDMAGHERAEVIGNIYENPELMCHT